MGLVLAAYVDSTGAPENLRTGEFQAAHIGQNGLHGTRLAVQVAHMEDI